MAKKVEKPAKKQQKTGASDAAQPVPNILGFRVPPGALVWGIMKEVDGAFVRCRVYEAGQAVDRWSIDTLPTVAKIGARWGRGRFKLLWMTLDFTNKGVSRIITIDDPTLPIGSPYPNKPSASDVPTLAPDPVAPGDRMTRIMQIAEGKLGPAATVAMLFTMLEEGSTRHAAEADRRAQQEIERQRARARLEREEDEARHRRQLEEDDARWKRRLKEEQEYRELERTRREEEESSSELVELREKVAALEEGGGGEGKSDMLSEKVGKLLDEILPHVPTVGRFVWEAIGEKAAKNKGGGNTT